MLANATSLPAAARLFAAALSEASARYWALKAGRKPANASLRLDLRLDAKCDYPPERARTLKSAERTTGVVIYSGVTTRRPARVT